MYFTSLYLEIPPKCGQPQNELCPSSDAFGFAPFTPRLVHAHPDSFRPCAALAICLSDHCIVAALQYVGINLRGFHLAVSQLFLHGMDVISRIQKERRKGWQLSRL